MSNGDHWTYDYTVPGADIEQLDAEVRAAGITGLLGINGPPPNLLIIFNRQLTAPEVLQLNSVVAAHTPDPDGQKKRVRASAKAALDTLENHTLVLLRAFALLTLDQVNQLRTSPTTAFPVITKAAFLTALRNKIDSGEADV